MQAVPGRQATRAYADVMSDWLVRHQRLVNVSAGVAGSIVIARTLLLAWPEYWPWMSEAGDLLYDLGIAWVTAWAFQLLVIVMPAERERKRFNDLIAPRVDRLIRLGMETVLIFDRQHGKRPQSSYSFDPETLQWVCENVALRDPAPGWEGSLGTVLRHLGNRAQIARATLIPFYSRLTPELLDALEQEELAMEQILQMERFTSATHASNMTQLETPLFRWFTSINMLCALRAASLAPELPLPKQSAIDIAMVRVPMDEFVRQQERTRESFEPEQA